MNVSLEVHGAVGIITLDRPPANAFDEAQTERFAAAVDAAARNPEIRSIVIGSAQKVFCGGADIAMMDSWRAAPDRGERLDQFCARLQDAFASLEALPKPTIAAINGAATGGGLELALACDFRIARGTAKLGLPEVGIGLLPGAGGTQRLTRLAGPSAAHRLILGAELIDGRTAEQLGIVHWAVDDVDAKTASLATRLAELSAPAYASAKRCIAETNTDHGFDLERAEIRKLIHTPEAAERLEQFVGRVR